MATGLLKPLAVFASQPQSQRYIKSTRNLGDSWQSLAENPHLESDANSAVVETQFDFILKIVKPLEGPTLEEKDLSKQSIVQMSTNENLYPSSVEEIAPEEHPRLYRIFADYGTDFIWRDPDDVRPEEGEDIVLDPEEVLASYPPSVLELYDYWVDTYTENFKTRLEETGDYNADLFLTVSEAVAWNVAGFLLAWRISMAPDVGGVEYEVGSSSYVLKKGEETSVTLKFLQDQADILEKGL